MSAPSRLRSGLVVALALVGCAREERTVVVVNVNVASGAMPGPITTLRVTLDDHKRSATEEFRSPTPISFPTFFTLDLPKSLLNATVALAVSGRGPDGTPVAERVVDPLRIEPTIDILLECPGACGTSRDGGAPDGPGGPGMDARPADGAGADVSPGCGNGKLDPGETCDIAAAPGQNGACPATCDDRIGCTADSFVGSGCQVQCVHHQMRTPAPNDRCCPAGATHATDPDCSPTCGDGALQAGETCDKRIPAGSLGACPTLAGCTSMDPCARAVLVSADTCAAVCARDAVTASIGGDGCCPAGTTSAFDSDCPVVCGNGKVESEAGETCDPGIAAPAPGSCPTACNDDQACTKDVLEGSGCRLQCKHPPITEMRADDGCCPPGANRNVDSDCPALCGNGVVEAGEACDKAIVQGKEGACPAACADPAMGCMRPKLDGRAADCTARCVVTTVTACLAKQKDGCCPGGCSALDDADCSPSCGNKQVEPGETCDTGIAAGDGRCPTMCADGDPCTMDTLASKGTCSAACQFVPVTAFESDDQCCPPGGNALKDSDCAPVCGNQVVEGPRESCDKGLAPGSAGACPTSCPAAPVCSRNNLVGLADECTARCATEAITECTGGDGCCPTGCNKKNDLDCPAVCGNAVVEPGEACDHGITAGHEGACPASCDDNDACTSETASGRVEDCTRQCPPSPPVEACTAGDRCCPKGCEDTDTDCAATCGNSIIESKETCDPPGTCLTTCAGDGDACTADRLIGDPAKCTAACAHVAITACSAASDGCCPTGCSPGQDVDCASAPTRPPAGPF